MELMMAYYLDYCLVPNLALKMESKMAAMMADYLDCCLALSLALMMEKHMAPMMVIKTVPHMMERRNWPKIYCLLLI